MAGASGQSALRREIATLAAFVLVLLILPGFAPGAWAPSGPASGPASGHGTAHSLPTGLSRTGTGPRTSAPAVSAYSSFYNSSVIPTSSFPMVCNGFCEQAAQSPSVMKLGNGDMGAAFSVVTNQTLSTCAVATGNVTIQVVFSSSSNGGATWGSPTLLGNAGTSTCPYYQELEPSFASSATGEVFGAYVEANATPAQMNQAYGSPIYPYTARYQDALAYVNSTTNGSTFANARALVVGNVSRPALATFGRSVYIVYQNISNGTTTTVIPGGQQPISLNFLYSTDAGVTWHGPSVLPVEPNGDPLEYNTTLSPSIAVNATGTIAIAFADNRSCIAFCGAGFGQAYGFDIVAITSTTNGTSWTRPVRIASGAGEAAGNTAYGVFEDGPTTTVAFGPTAGTLYVAFSASYNISIIDPAYAAFVGQFDWGRPTVYASASIDNGATFGPPVMVPAPLRSADDFQQLFGEGNFNPGIGVSPSGRVYLTWSYNSWTNGACGFSAFTANAYDQGNVQYLATSPNGVSWSTPTLVNVSTQSAGIDYLNYLGYTASVAFTASGQPVVGYTMDTVFLNFNFTTFQLYSQTQLQVAVPYIGPTTNVTFIENGLASGTAWTALVGGVGLNTTASSFTVTGVPSGRPLYVQWPYGFPRPGSVSPFVAPVVSDMSGPYQTPPVFTHNSTIYFNFTTFYPLTLSPEPIDYPSMSAYWQNYGPNASFGFNGYWSTFIYPPYIYPSQYSGCPQPWFFPKGMNLPIGGSLPNGQLSMNGAGPIDYWSGTGQDNYTGSSPVANVTMEGAVNETFWIAGVGNYSEQINALGLPATSTFQVTVDGQTYSGPAAAALSVPGLKTGPHWLANLSASSSTAGWEYFGHADTGSPFVLPEQPIVNVSYAYVDVGASAGTVHFHAPQVPSGTTWNLEVNGTTYSSSTPWINITSHPGTFPVNAYPVVQANGGATLTPDNASEDLSVTTGSTYDINFTAAYRLTVTGTSGGRTAVTGGNLGYYVPGSSVTFNATPSSGYTWGGWTGSGTGAYTGPNETATITVGSAIDEVARFVPLPQNRFNLTVNAFGIPNGTEWSVNLNGVGYSSNTSTLVIHNLFAYSGSGNVGRYTLQVPYAYANSTAPGTRYVPSSYSATAFGGGSTSVTFSTQYYLEALSTTGGTVSTVSGWQVPNTAIQLSATALPGYQFVDWQGTGSGSYSGTVASTTISISGPVSETAVFEPVPHPAAPRYTVSLRAATAFAAGTTWSVTFNGTNVTSATSYLNVSGLLAGTYAVIVHTALSPDGLTLYTPSGAPDQVSVSADYSKTLSFITSYWLAVQTAGAGTTTVGSGWHVAGTQVTVNATPTGDNVFVSWAGTGPGNYSGTDSQFTVLMNAPLSEVASFAAPPPSSTSTTTSSSFWASPILWAGLAVVGLVIGLAFGVLFARRRSPPPPRAPVAPAETYGEPPASDAAPEGEP